MLPPQSCGMQVVPNFIGTPPTALHLKG
jgi:hypothetical protein